MLVRVFVGEVRVIFVVFAKTVCKRFPSSRWENSAIFQANTLCDFPCHFIALIFAGFWGLGLFSLAILIEIEHTVRLDNIDVLINGLDLTLWRTIPLKDPFLLWILWPKSLDFLQVLLQIKLFIVVKISAFRSRNILRKKRSHFECLLILLITKFSLLLQRHN